MMKRDPSQLSDGEFDLLVVGGGISGACVVRDAARRGLRAALVDRGDFGAEASANSLRIVHGGLRYLQQMNLRRMRESIRERSMWLRTAPHLVHPLAFMVATSGRGARSRTAMRAALLMNDCVGFDRNRGLDASRRIRGGRILGRAEASALYPGAARDCISGGAMWYDARMHHSERLVVAVVLDAVTAGAAAVNYVTVEKLTRVGRRVTGAEVRDALTGASFDVRAKVVVVAGGPGSERLVTAATGGKTAVRSWVPALGMNVLTRRPGGEPAVGVPVGERHGGSAGRGSRMLFLTPWRGLSLIGTAYYRRPDASGVCRATDEEVSRFVNQINAACPQMALTMEDVLAVQAGWIPIAAGGEADGGVRFLERHHVVDAYRTGRVAGLIGLRAIKYTTARRAAEDVVNLVFRKLRRGSPACVTDTAAVYGGDTGPFEAFVVEQAERWSDVADRSAVRRLACLYGTRLADVLDACAGRRRGRVNQEDVAAGEVLHAVRCEMAVKLGDTVFRRTDLGSRGHPGDGPIRAAAEVMATELGWDAERRRAEVEAVLNELCRRRCVGTGLPTEGGGADGGDRRSVAVGSAAGG